MILTIVRARGVITRKPSKSVYIPPSNPMKARRRGGKKLEERKGNQPDDRISEQWQWNNGRV